MTKMFFSFLFDIFFSVFVSTPFCSFPFLVFFFFFSFYIESRAIGSPVVAFRRFKMEDLEISIDRSRRLG